MSTEAQDSANLANAQHSTGPRTGEGKAASSQNALKHGLTAKSVLLPGEDEAAYREMCQGMFQTFAPANQVETGLVQFLCDTQWRLQRCPRVEAAILSVEIPDFKALDNLSKHEARLKRQYSATLKEANELIGKRLQFEQEQMKLALRIRRADRIDGCTTDLQEIGFVFSNEKIDAALLREDTLVAANQVLAKAHSNRN